MPISAVSLYLTEACNLRCRYCFLAKQPRRLPLDLGRQVIDFMVAAPPQVKKLSVFFFGGEPLLEFDTIRELTTYGLAEADRRGKKLHLGVTTNGTLMTDSMIEFIFKHRISVNLSLDGQPATQNHNRKTIAGKPSFPLIDSVIDELLARNPNQSARMTYDTHSVHSLYADHEYLWSRGFINTSPIAAFEDDWTPEKLAVANEQYQLIARAVLDRMRLGDLRRVTFLVKYINRMHYNAERMRIPCGVCAGYIGVSVDGAVYPCQRFAAAARCAFGSIWELTDRDTRAEFLSFTSEKLVGCEGCSARFVCAGGCPAVNVLCGGSLDYPWPHQCAIIRREYDAALWLYQRLQEENNPLLQKLIGKPRQAPGKRRARDRGKDRSQSARSAVVS